MELLWDVLAIDRLNVTDVEEVA